MSNLVNAKNTRLISIFPSNATTFQASQKAIFDLPADLGYVKGRSSYLVLDVENTSTRSDRWTFPSGVGVSSLIKRVDWYSRSTGQLLESLSNLNQWIGCQNQYNRDDFTTRQQLEGTGKRNFSWYNNLNKTPPHTQETWELRADPTFVENNMLSPLVDVTCANSYTPRRFVLPVHSGLFSRTWDDDERLCPVLNLGGLRCEITFSDNNEVCKTLSMKPDLPANVNKKNVLSLLTSYIKCHTLSAVQGTAFIVLTDETNTNGYFSTTDRLGLAVGNLIYVSGEVAGVREESARYIHSITQSGTAGRITVQVVLPMAFTGAVTSVRVHLNKSIGATTIQETKPSYTVTNAEMRVVQMVVDNKAMDKLGKPMSYEFTSYDHFVNTIPSGSKRHQIPVNSVASKGRAIFTQFTPVDDEHDKEKMGYYTGTRPSEMYLSSLQLFMNNRLYPMTSYDPGEKRDKVIVMNELVKAFSSIAQPVMSLGSSEDGQMENYSNTFLYARELSRSTYYTPLQMSECEIRLGFSNTRGQNVRCNTYVFSKKTVNISPQGLVVEM